MQRIPLSPSDSARGIEEPSIDSNALLILQANPDLHAPIRNIGRNKGIAAVVTCICGMQHRYMTDIALHLAPAGLSYALMPEPFDEAREHLISVEFRSWPSGELGQHRTPRELFERSLAYDLLTDVTQIFNVDTAVLTVEEGTDGRLVGACELALHHADVAVVVRPPHPAGPAELAREWFAETVRAWPPMP
ncbi:hypothetical protein [Aliihoeflea sp. 40Bstr573]|uniref:hypothetical protein n=1 Tax=Aliihoeflea sp. 40Bstr573 TaxID=2696467 RepID=UPI002094C2EF|nr:hypothetical protein [Aliihoeflea sp. 40Bstr573]MCO6389386.1 hypothetical protein [Aliihoeflea sp. 40Bstr573]